MDGTKIISALLPVAIALAAEGTVADAQASSFNEIQQRFSTRPGMVRVSVENPNWAEVRVYIAVRGGYVPIGTARRLTSTTFNVPGELLRGRATVLLLAHPVTETHNTVATRVRLNPSGGVTWEITGLATRRVQRPRA